MTVRELVASLSVLDQDAKVLKENRAGSDSFTGTVALLLEGIELVDPLDGSTSLCFGWNRHEQAAQATKNYAQKTGRTLEARKVYEIS